MRRTVRYVHQHQLPESLMALCYILIFAMVCAAHAYIRWRADGFDSNGNSVFSTDELTDVNATYLIRIDIQNTARTFIPFTAILFAMFATAVGYVMGLAQRFVQWLLRAG